VIGYAFCGSFCTARRSIGILRILREKYEILPIVSPAFAATDTRFGKAADLISEIEDICSKKCVDTILAAEPLGPARPLEALVISPCTGNTLAKMACGITDTPVTMAAKAHLRSCRPLLIALATNDALSANLRSLGVMLARKNVFFVPLGQDDPVNKPSSLVCDFERIPEALEQALEGKQLQPLLI